MVHSKAIISFAQGPSGPNDVYLLHLHEFLTHAAQHSKDAALALEDYSGDVNTGELARMLKLLQTEYRPHFLFGAGSNEHNQLLLSPSETDNNSEVNEVHELTEMLLVTLRLQDEADELVSLHAGGGHSALLTKSGAMHTWGWNDAGQLGRLNNPQEDSVSSLANVPPLSIKIAVADLGHTHTLVIEKDTGRLFGFGENGRGQVDGLVNSNALTTSIHTPTTPSGLIDEQFVEVAAGLFHSAAITVDGDLVTFGCSRFRQSLPPDNDTSSIGRWRPSDGSKLVQVTCGRRHTVMLDDLGRVWTLGLENKYGQLGRSKSLDSPTPQLVDGPLGQPNSGCVVLTSGWSHILALIRKKDGTVLYGWGRNDKGQLGKQNERDFIATPQVIDVPSCVANSFSVQSVCCGAESSHLALDNGDMYSCGWDEHGNLGVGYLQEKNNECWGWRPMLGSRVVAPPPNKETEIVFAAGGAHIIAMAKGVL